MFSIAYSFKGQVHVFAGRVKIVSQFHTPPDKFYIEIFSSPGFVFKRVKTIDMVTVWSSV